REIARINAFDTGEGASTYKVNGKLITLPAEFKKRRANRGMEGLTVTPDQKYLVGIMQSALYNPDKTTKKSTMTRLVRIELATGNIEQFIYQQQSTDSDSNSGIVAIDKDTFYVIERDGELPQFNAAAIKKVYKIGLASATNLESITNTTDIVQDVNLGLMVGGKTLEQLTLTA
ncbi:esterase-like activity of phytase family protein, partial [Salmonella enterica subsp. enterica]|nr:esterase-like activity of phytase family protein [Salmonella enterica subsp. enterica serovar Bovismorbificans]